LYIPFGTSFTPLRRERKKRRKEKGRENPLSPCRRPRALPSFNVRWWFNGGETRKKGGRSHPLVVSLIGLLVKSNYLISGLIGEKIREIDPFRIYDSHAFNMLSELDPELSKKIRAFYCLTKLKIMSLRHSADGSFPFVIEVLVDLEGWPKISGKWDEGWKDLENAGVEIIGSLDDICQ
jgi:hypothetical protein